MNQKSVLSLLSLSFLVLFSPFVFAVQKHLTAKPVYDQPDDAALKTAAHLMNKHNDFRQSWIAATGDKIHSSQLVITNTQTRITSRGQFRRVKVATQDRAPNGKPYAVATVTIRELTTDRPRGRIGSGPKKQVGPGWTGYTGVSIRRRVHINDFPPEYDLPLGDPHNTASQVGYTYDRDPND